MRRYFPFPRPATVSLCSLIYQHLNNHFLSREGIHQSHCDSALSLGVLPAIESSSRPMEPIRALASETLGPLGCRATPNGRVSTYSSPPPSPPLSPPPSLPLPACRPEAQSPGFSPPPTLNDPVTRDTTPSLLSLEETGDKLSVLEAMMSHP